MALRDAIEQFRYYQKNSAKEHMGVDSEDSCEAVHGVGDDRSIGVGTFQGKITLTLVPTTRRIPCRGIQEK